MIRRKDNISQGSTVYFTDILDETNLLPANFRGWLDDDNVVVVCDGSQFVLEANRVFTSKEMVGQIVPSKPTGPEITEPLQGLSRNQTGNLIVFYSNITCGEGCWSAREEVCKCSCGGKNHGISLRGENAVRTAKIDGYKYELHSVGTHSDLMKLACELQKEIDIASGFCWEENGELMQKGYVGDKPFRYTTAGYRFNFTGRGDDFRIKYATLSQCIKWQELEYFDVMTDRDRYRSNAAILWKLVDTPKFR